MTNRALSSIAVGLCLGLCSLSSIAAPAYAVIDLGQGVVATDLNAVGRVVGAVTTADGYDRAFITGPNGAGMVMLDTLGGPESHATAVNSTGQVVGYSYTTSDIRSGPRHAFITGADGIGLTDLGTLGGTSSLYGAYSAATDINDRGQVVGVSYIPGGHERVFVDDARGGGMRPLNIDHYSTTGAVVNAKGRVAGNYNKDGEVLAFLTGDDAMGVTTIAPGMSQPLTVRGVNDSGQIVGELLYANAVWPRATVTGADGVGMTDLGTLGGLFSSGLDINSLGQVVGVSTTADVSRHAFVSGVGGVGMVDLNALVTLAGGASLSEAVAINDKGWIVANSGNGHAYLLTPVPEPQTFSLMVLGVLVLVCSATWRAGARHTEALRCSGRGA